MTVRARATALACAVSLAPIALATLAPAVGVRAQEAAPRSDAASLPAPSRDLLAELEAVYRDLHAHPELSMQEHRTAAVAAAWLKAHGYEVTEGVGGTGVVGVLRNGTGATVLLRADMDALPIEERSGLPYASRQTGTDRFGQATAIAHACGHDMHVAWLMGAARVLAANRDAWRGTVLAVFQPGEETAQGARAMLEDGMVERFPKPDVVLGQHVLPLPAGQIGLRVGPVLSMGDTWEVTLFGRGGHGSAPHKTVDPVVMAAATALRLQTIVSREVAMNDAAVVSIGALQAGSSPNVIPDRAVLRLDVRTFEPPVRERVLAAIRRIVEAEAAASGAPQPPTFTTLSEFPLTFNDEAATRRVTAAFEGRFGAERVQEIAPASASEDFALFARAWNVPAVYWIVGGTDHGAFERAQAAGRADEMPSNHEPSFAPVIHPTLGAGIEAMLAAAGVWLAEGDAEPEGAAR